MADLEDTPMRTEDEDSATSTGSESEEEEQQVEWLATGREKRSTAGNRLASLLQQEESDDELELLFQEAEDDAGFEDVEGNQSDVQMDSSDDDDDQGPAAGADDLEGEKELQRQAKAEKAKKRKMNDGMAKMFKKRVRIDATAADQAPAPRPKKKSERASWIPTPEDAPTRSSSRKTTKLQKRELHQQMVEREIKRLKQLANMEKAAAAKEAAKKPAMTQADHLKEAARVEKMNSKSLSKWEEAEAQREEDQKAKLAALKNRTMEGPFMTWWSGMGEYVGGKLRQVGKSLKIEEKEKHAPRKRKAAEMEVDSEDVSTLAEPGRASQEPGKKEASVPADTPRPDGVVSNTPFTKSPSAPPNTSPPPPPLQPIGREIPNTPSYPSHPIGNPLPPLLHPPLEPPRPPNSSVLAPPAGLPLTAPPLPPYFINGASSSYASFGLAPPALDGSLPLPGFGYHVPQQPRFLPPQSPLFSYPPVQHQSPLPDIPPPPPPIEHAARNYLILENFDEAAVKDKNVQTQIIFGRKFVKVQKSKHNHELCAITGQPARYRDPETGLAYFNAYAYKEIQKLKRGDYRWSKLVGAYVGQATYAARGVPERFKAALVGYKAPVLAAPVLAVAAPIVLPDGEKAS